MYRRRGSQQAGAVGLCAAIVSLAGTGCGQLPGQAVSRIRQGHAAYEHGDYTRAEQMLSRVIAEHASHPDTGEAYYVRGLSRLRVGRAEPAHQDFRAGLLVAERPELRALLNAQLGNLAYEHGQYQNAAAYYDQARPDLPGHPPTDRILLRHGISLQRCGRFPEAKQVLADLLTSFPAGPAAAEAREKIGWTGDYYAIQCGVYGESGNAESAARKLRAAGVEASAWRETRDGATRYVVRAGRYPQRAAAERDLPQIRRIIPDAFVVP